MSFWDKRHGEIGRHVHLPSQILNETTGSPNAGSSLTIDNQSDPPATVTTLVAPGAVITDGSADLSRVVARIDSVAQTDATTPGLIVQNSDASHDYLRVAASDEDAAVVIAPDAVGDGLIVKSALDRGANIVLATSLGRGDITLIDRLQIYADAGDSGAGSGVDLIAVTRNSRLTTAPDDQADPYPGGVFRVLYGGAIVTGQRYAPADGDLAAGQCALWFDPTDGAAKLMIKAKSANGSVVTGAVDLA